MPSDDVPELPEYRDNAFINRLPPILSTAEALAALHQPPFFDERERSYPAHIRAHCIQRLGRYFVPFGHHLTLEARFSMMLRQGYVGRNPANMVRRLQNDHERVSQRDIKAFRHPMPSTAYGLSLVGCSGMGKSTSLRTILSLYPQVVHHTEPFSLDQLVWLKLDCPYKGSPKQLCIAFFAAVDDLLGTRYLAQYGSSRRGVDEIMVHMAHVADLHALGALVIDEIQHLKQAPGTGSDDMLNFLVTLINTIGIPVLIVGTLGALPLLQGAFRQARRASGMGSLLWERLKPDDTWNHFIDEMWQYQWLEERTPLTEEIRDVLYDESQGIVDLVIKLFMLAQIHAMQLRFGKRRPERLDAGLLRHVARENFQLVRPMIDALRSGDERKIAKYDDLRPLNDYLKQVFVDATLRLTPTPAPRKPSASPPTEESPHVGILAALEGLGIPADIGKALLAQVMADNPDAEPIELVALVADALKRKEPATRAEPKKSTKKPAQPEPSEPDDLRVIVAQSRESEATAYEALLAAGVVKPPLSDFAA